MPKSRKIEPKLPAKQLAILAVARFAEPLALTSVFPYLPEMIKSFGVAENDVAKYAGMTSAMFSFAQSMTAVPWGRASDSMGRKWTIIIGLFSTMTCFLIWGVSTSLPMAIIVRAIQGAGNGNVGIIRTMVAELVPERELQPRAFSIMPLVWSIGSVFGPAFGGMLAMPAERFPGVFGNSTFFKTYPFALPNIVAAVFFLISMTTATLFLRETLEGRREHADWGLLMGQRIARTFKRGGRKPRSRRRSFVDGEATAPLLPTKRSGQKQIGGRDSPLPQRRPGMRDVFTPQTTIGIAAYALLALHSVAYDQVLPVFLSHKVQEHTPENTNLPFRFSGGFGLGPNKIGTITTIYGVACGLIQFIVFPPLCSWLGVLKCYKICCVIFPAVYILTPYAVLLPTDPLRYAVLGTIMLVKAFAVIVGFPCMTILLTNSASSLRILGTLNGFATTFSGLGRAVGPAAAGAAFSWGVGVGYVITAWWFLAVVAVIGAVPAWFIVDGDGPTAGHASNSSDSESGSDDEDGEEDGGTAREDSAVVLDSDEEDADDEGTAGAHLTSPLLRDAKGKSTGYDATRRSGRR